MRHPFWKWTKWLSWLSVGLSGCLHGQDWRAAVSKPLTRPVADRRESLPQPKVVGPLRKTLPTFVPPNSIPTPAAAVAPPTRVSAPAVVGPKGSSSQTSSPSAGHLTPSAIAARPPAFTALGSDQTTQVSAEELRPPTTQDEAQPRGANVTATEFTPPPAPPAEPISVPAPALPAPSVVEIPPVRELPPSVNVQTSARDAFAEFERTIPRGKSGVTRVSKELPPPDEKPVMVIVPEREATPEPSLPLIIPARTTVPIIQPSVARSLPPETAKELPDVSDAITTAPAAPSAVQESTARPRDVAVLVEQVFEDLRQRRMDDARQRTQWLKQLVAKRLPVEEAAAEAPAVESEEPQRLHIDPNATPVDTAPSEKALDDEEPANRS